MLMSRMECTNVYKAENRQTIHEPMCRIGIYVNINIFFVTFCPFIVSRNNSKASQFSYREKKPLFLSFIDFKNKHKQNAAQYIGVYSSI
jgi:hypothetical protein